MIVQGKPRQLQAKRRPDYGLKVYATDPVKTAGVVAGTIGYVDGIYSDGTVLVRYHGGEYGTVIYDRQALRLYTKPFAWVQLAERPGREVATLYHWN